MLSSGKGVHLQQREGAQPPSQDQGERKMMPAHGGGYIDSAPGSWEYNDISSLCNSGKVLRDKGGRGCQHLGHGGEFLKSCIRHH